MTLWPCRSSRRNGASTTSRLVRGPLRGHSALMLAVRMILAHLSFSSETKLPNSLCVIGIGIPPILVKRALTSESARPALISRSSVSTIPMGVLRGTPTPAHKVVSKRGRKSLTGGIFGKPSHLVGLVTATARSLPASTCSIDEAIVGNIICTCPASRSVNAGAAPR